MRHLDAADLEIVESVTPPGPGFRNITVTDAAIWWPVSARRGIRGRPDRHPSPGNRFRDVGRQFFRARIGVFGGNSSPHRVVVQVHRFGGRWQRVDRPGYYMCVPVRLAKASRPGSVAACGCCSRSAVIFWMGLRYRTSSGAACSAARSAR